MNALRLIGALLPVLAPTPTALGVLPPDFIMEYRMREIPDDPNSDLTFVVTLKLSADTVDGDDAGWEVTEILIDQYDGNGAISDMWSESVPFVDTVDGLWWVTHADVNRPYTGEFDMPPVVSGTAPAQSSTEDLKYSFNGEVYVPPSAPGEPPYRSTVAVTYEFVLAASDETIADKEEEPAESDGTEDPH